MSPNVACADCGKPVDVDPDVFPQLRSMAERIIRGEQGVQCAECTKAEDEKEQEDALREMRVRRMRRRATIASVPDKWLGCEWEELEVDEQRAAAIKAARRWAEGKPRKPGLLLYGPAGRGKSRIAGTAAVSRLARGNVRWLNIARIVMDLRMPIQSAEYAAAQRALSPGRTAALVIDDLDKLPPTENAVQAIYLAINEWTEAGRPLLLTSNKDPEAVAIDFGPRYGAPIASRLMEHCNIYPVLGRDRRTD